MLHEAKNFLELAITIRRLFHSYMGLYVPESKTVEQMAKEINERTEEDLHPAILLVNSNRGVYTCQEFAKYFRQELIDARVFQTAVLGYNEPLDEDDFSWVLDVMASGPDQHDYVDACTELENLTLLWHNQLYMVYENEEGIWAERLVDFYYKSEHELY